MRAKIAAIESKDGWKDGQRRIVLNFGDHSMLRVPEKALGIVGLGLDDEIEVSFFPIREQAKSEAA